MTIEEKAKAYDEAKKRMEAIYPSLTHEQQMEAEAFFPELKESEDEKIRKWCISHFKACFRVTKDNAEYKEYLNNKVIPWLEKQGEQKPVEWSEEDEHRINDAIYFLETAKKHYASVIEIEATIDWLKSPQRQTSSTTKARVEQGR